MEVEVRVCKFRPLQSLANLQGNPLVVLILCKTGFQSTFFSELVQMYSCSSPAITGSVEALISSIKKEKSLTKSVRVAMAE
jgi:hypothetical protein